MSLPRPFRPRPEPTTPRLTAILNVLALLVFYIAVNSRTEVTSGGGFDSVRLHAVLQKMAASDPSPLATVKPMEAEPAPSAATSLFNPENEIEAKPKHRARGTGSLAPSNLNAILDGPMENSDLSGDSDSDKSDLGPGLTSTGVGANKKRGGASTGTGKVTTGGFVIGGKGEVARSAVEKALSRRRTQMQNCYQAALLENPALAGKLLLRWTVSKEGEAEGVLIENSQLDNAELHSCIVQEVSKTEFPKPQGGSIIIRYPLTFSVD